jgi:hypothetical protein
MYTGCRKMMFGDISTMRELIFIQVYLEVNLSVQIPFIMKKINKKGLSLILFGFFYYWFWPPNSDFLPEGWLFHIQKTPNEFLGITEMSYTRNLSLWSMLRCAKSVVRPKCASLQTSWVHPTNKLIIHVNTCFYYIT